ncbi:MAG: FAD-dependent oxidoreductase [candidate division Zixibacteria bacterium]|nr:FAD-dependent oxidoreductase [candidate division Zixibacteria bacterium]
MEVQDIKGDEISCDLLVVGGGIAGTTTALEASEVGAKAVLIEKTPMLGGRVIRTNQYFPKMCPPSCGLEINLKRIRQNENITVSTLTEVEQVSGSPGNYEVTLRINPRYVNDKCTACGDCAKVCEIKRPNELNYGLDETTAIYLPHKMAFPHRYVIDPEYVNDDRMKKCVEACHYDAIELDMQPRTVKVKAGSIVWTTGWDPYDAEKIDNLGYGKYKNVVTNVIMERLASADGPTEGKIQRLSDGEAPKKVAFVQCAGSRDENHLPYCSGVCCMASMKQARYVRDQLPESECHVFYIDIRSPGRLEDFYLKCQDDEMIHFHRGKVARITEEDGTGKLILEAENTLTGEITKTTADMVVLATGMVPTTSKAAPPLDTKLDEFGFIDQENTSGIIGAGTVMRPCEVSASIQDATGAALKGILDSKGGNH